MSAARESDMQWHRQGLSAYVMSEPIASGGMGTVHLAVTADAAEPILAVKRVHRHLLPDPSFAQMLAAESAVASRVAHGNAVATFGTETYGDELVMVMEYVHGLTLRAIGDKCRARRLPPRIAGAIIADALRGLHAAHEAKDDRGRDLRIVHCDVSPQNILVGVDGRARLVDFGVARADGLKQEPRRGELHCKLAYASPEQIRGERVDRRTDVFAAAIVLWELLVGDALFAPPGAGEWNVVAKVLAGEVTRPCLIVPQIPTGLDAVVMRALSPLPRDRFQTALDMAIAIDTVFTNDPVTSAELGMWMQSISSTDLDLIDRAQWISNARRTSRIQTRALPVPAKGLSVPAPLLGLYCLIFACSLAFGLIGIRALGSGNDHALGAENVR